MSIERINPAGLSHPPTYTHVVRATGGSTVYISGQVPVDADGRLVETARRMPVSGPDQSGSLCGAGQFPAAGNRLPDRDC